jgi:fumarylacetoacetate (FAA) hydrolase family protein
MAALKAQDLLPDDVELAVLIGRVWDPASGGPRVVSLRDDAVYDLTPLVGTVSALLEREDALDLARNHGTRLGWSLAELLEESAGQSAEIDPTRPRLLAPIDLQVIKACGVTFADSMIERLIEERAGGDPDKATELRATVLGTIGDRLLSARAGSPGAAVVKARLIEQGMWSQYLEVGIGPDPEVFTKAPVLSAVGVGAAVGIPAFSHWNNPEPELVLAVNSRGEVRGAALGNDVNLRDVEGRSALLLGMAKDNNASTAIGPFIRLFDEGFTIETLRNEEILLSVDGTDGYRLEGRNSLSRISRPFERLVAATIGDHHQYPDGFVLFTGTLFAPTEDRDEPGQGFTHKPGDVVTISSANLGALVNTVGASENLPRWSYGIGELLRYLAG